MTRRYHVKSYFCIHCKSRCVTKEPVAGKIRSVFSSPQKYFVAVTGQTNEMLSSPSVPLVILMDD